MELDLKIGGERGGVFSRSADPTWSAVCSFRVDRVTVSLEYADGPLESPGFMGRLRSCGECGSRRVVERFGAMRRSRCSRGPEALCAGDNFTADGFGHVSSPEDLPRVVFPLLHFRVVVKTFCLMLENCCTD